MSTELRNITERKQQITPKTFGEYVGTNGVQQIIKSVLGADRINRFVTSIVSLVSNTQALQECTHKSIISAALQGEALNLSPSSILGHFFLVPYKDRKNNTVTAQFQIGYKGYVQLAIRSGVYKRINVLALKKGELISYNPLTEEIYVDLITDEDVRESAETVAYYAMFELQNGFTKSILWSKEKMEKHADKYSAAFSMQKKHDLDSGKIQASEAWKYSSYWYKSFDEMAYKTLLRQLISKWGIMSIDMQQAFEVDQTAEVNNENVFIDSSQHIGIKESIESEFFGDYENDKNNAY